MAFPFQRLEVKVLCNMVGLFYVFFTLALPTEAKVSTGQMFADFRPGHITNMVVPGDPVQELNAVGFVSAHEALRFVDNGFTRGEPVFKATLQRGDSVALGNATHVVFFYVDENKKPVLLAVTRCHGDLHLVVGFCGYQFLVNVNLPLPAEPVPSSGKASRERLR